MNFSGHRRVDKNPAVLRLSVGLSTAAVVIGCFPFHGKIQTEIPSNPVFIRDARTGAVLETVLVLPRYTEASSLAQPTIYVGHAFVYRSGERFAPVAKGRATGIVWGPYWGFTGAAETNDGYLLVAPGYKSRFVYWSRQEGEEQFRLEPLPGDAAKQELMDIDRLLAVQILNGTGAERWDVGHDTPVYVRLTPEQLTLAHSFLAAGLSQLGTQKDPPGD